ncbi:unnamed protein product, partial [marine sediment metagenome]
ILFMIDAQHKNHLNLMTEELYKAGLRLNQKKPDVVVKRTGHGGITINSTIKLSHLNEGVVKSISSEYVTNADIIIRDDITEDQLIDVFIQNRIYVPAVVIINKKDLLTKEELNKKIKNITQKNWDVISISASEGTGLDELKKVIFSELKLTRTYMKPVGEKP